MRTNLIDDRTVQQHLKDKGFYGGQIDGLFFSASTQAARRYVASLGEATKYRAIWSDERIRLAVEQLIFEGIGIDLGDIDGLDGPRTQIALERWQDHVQFHSHSNPVTGQKKTIFPRQKDAAAFYGEPGTGLTRITPPYPVFYGWQPVATILIHSKCAESALRILERVHDRYGEDEIHRLGLDRFSGCFNNRPMRNGTQLSMHAYACAWDWDAARNPLRATAATAQFAKKEYGDFIAAHYAEGWISLGRERNFDWMHFQAARL